MALATEAFNQYRERAMTLRPVAPLSLPQPQDQSFSGAIKRSRSKVNGRVVPLGIRTRSHNASDAEKPTPISSRRRSLDELDRDHEPSTKRTIAPVEEQKDSPPSVILRDLALFPSVPISNPLQLPLCTPHVSPVPSPMAPGAEDRFSAQCDKCKLLGIALNHAVRKCSAEKDRTAQLEYSNKIMSNDLSWLTHQYNSLHNQLCIATQHPTRYQDQLVINDLINQLNLANETVKRLSREVSEKTLLADVVCRRLDMVNKQLLELDNK